MAKLKLFNYQFTAMGSPCEIQLYAIDKNQVQIIADPVIADIYRLEQRYSRYKNDSILSEINRCAATAKSIEVDAETASLLNYAVTCFDQSDGLFDITSGILSKVWHFNKRTLSLPDPELIEQVLKRVGWDKVRWTNPLLSFSRSGMELDFGGIVKEYAADRAASICSAMGVKHGLVNLGGDIKVIGSHPDSSPWRIGVRNPQQKNTVISVVELNSGGMATSGDYERCIEIKGKRYGHILNPKTGWPVQYLASVTVISDFCVLAGSASTIAILKEQEGIAWLDALSLPYQWIDKEGKIGNHL